MPKASTSSAVRFTDNGDGTITDSKTNLIWMKEDDDKERNWKDAIAYCESNESKLPGDGWRLPTIEELRTLIDYTRHHPAIDPIFKCQSSWYWTSTPCAYDSGSAWGVNFNFGGVGWSYVGNEFFVRAVRQNS